MSDHIEQTNCGTIVEKISPTDILTALETLTREYKNLQESAQLVGKRDFSQQALISSFRQVYETVLKK
jgi:hypothetical protein